MMTLGLGYIIGRALIGFSHARTGLGREADKYYDE
jgi:hypothetical protein